ncbi:MAG: methyl-accepting chemotaxis protein [Stutzerimonas sp.]
MKTLKVSHKLALGFAAILILTVAVALIGSFSMDALISRSDRAKIAEDLLDDANLIRYSRAGFENEGDRKYVEDVEKAVSRIVQRVQDTQGEFVEREDIDRLALIGSEAQRYGQSFLELVGYTDQKVRTRSSWVAAGNTSDALIAELEKRWVGTVDDPVLYETPEEASTGLLIGEVSRHNRMVRFLVRGYLMGEDEKSLQLLQDQFKTLQASLDRLDARLAGTPGVDLQPLHESVATYIRQFNQLPPLVAAQARVRQEMLDIFDTLYRNSVGIVKSQTDKRGAEAGEKKALLLLITLLAVGLGVLIGWLIVRQIVRPLSQAVLIAERIGAGDMTEHSRASRTDEFGLLLDALERTRGNLRELLGHIGGITHQLASSAQELSAVTEQTSAGIQSQRQETDQVATAMHEMAATVQEVARNANQASAAAQHADRQALQGNDVVRRALAQIDDLSSQIGLSAEAMEQLNQEAAGISTVLTVISGIAEQTNLLALNAAIEAARAGEAGRGFAVVADEVRGLAQRTQQSTAQIEELIGNLQKGTLNASSLMDSSRGLAAETVSLARDVGEELQAIVQSISTIQAMNLQIATASEEQSSVAEDINRSVLNVRDVADQSAAAAQQTAASTAELARLGSDLQGLAARFRV